MIPILALDWQKKAIDEFALMVEPAVKSLPIFQISIPKNYRTIVKLKNGIV
jgi:hypothetical protein